MYKEVKLKKHSGKFLKSGGLWIYDNEIDEIDSDIQDGDIVNVVDFDGYGLGVGFINTKSTITVRMLSRDKNSIINNDFLHDRVKKAWEYRKKVIDTSSCRIIFGEADFLPGLVIDKFSDVLVVESLCLGIDKLKNQIIDELKKVLLEDGIKIRGVYERSDAKVRLKEGMERFSGILGDEFNTDVEIIENGVKYIVDVKNGQKTGFFLDQKLNRLAIQKICKDAEVLDCFTHTGSFALNAAKGGAKHVTAVDSSETAIENAIRNAKLNGMENIVDFKCGDAFEILPEFAEQNKKYDVVILDPPAFTKSKNSVKSAAKGYEKINRWGMQLVKSNGILASCSCSHFMTAEALRAAIERAAKAEHKTLVQIEFRQAAPDHPFLVNSDNSFYLKFYIFRVIDNSEIFGFGGNE